MESIAVNLTQRVAAVGVVAMLGVGALSTLDVVVMRALLNSPLTGTNELLASVFSIAIAAVLASGIAQNATLEIDFLSNVLRPASVAWLRAVGAALFLVAVVILTWRIGDHAHQAYARGAALNLLLWKVWPFFVIVAFLFAICIPVQLLTFLRLVQTAGGAALPPARFARSAALVLASVIVVLALVYFGLQSAQPALKPRGTSVALFFFFFIWVLVLLFVPLAAALLFCGLYGAAALMGMPQALTVLGSEAAGLVMNADLGIIPLFLMMGGFSVAGGMSSDIYRLAHALFAPLRGGLALATIAGCAGFGALTGSSVATVATIGSAAYPEMKRRGYSSTLATGCIAAGGTLGQLVPPSTAIVIYALLVELSIGTLYIAVLIPALLTVVLYMTAIVATVLINPKAAPSGERFDARELVVALKDCGPVFLLLGTVLGGIFAGIFTATEAAAVGTVIAFVVALSRGRLRKGALWTVIGDTTRSTSMLYFVFIGALMLTFFMASSGLPDILVRGATHSGWPPIVIVSAFAFAYIALGCVMDSFTIMFITAPLMATVVVSLGYDPVWWAIMVVILVELGVVTPPFGMNLFVMKGVAPDVPLTAVYKGVAPFVIADVTKVVLMIAFPALVLWLPKMMLSIK
jgi:tripartite ATP-independent transporter DctM subunit